MQLNISSFISSNIADPTNRIFIIKMIENFTKICEDVSFHNYSTKHYKHLRVTIKATELVSNK